MENRHSTARESENTLELLYLDESKRDMILILPGGGYARTSPREGMPVALRFQGHGYHAAIYHYRKTKLTHPELIEEAIGFVEELYDEPLVRNLYIIGFSAGGHLALHILEKRPQLFKAGILCYPVVSADPEIAHEPSFKELFGRTPSSRERDEVSLEKHVSSDMPPIFLWHTMDDATVDVRNALVLMDALNSRGVAVETHLYPRGGHGLSLADETTTFDGVSPVEFKKRHIHVSRWVDEAIRFLEELDQL